MRTKSSGFTLLELLITASITAVIFAAIYSSFQTGILSYRKIDAAFGPYQMARNIFNRLELDVRNSFAYTAADSRFSGQEKAVDFFSVLEAYDEGKEFTNLYRIKYSVQEDLLTRDACAGADAPKIEISASCGRASYRIKDIQFQYAAQPADQTQSIVWQTIWPQDDNQKKSLPLAIKIKLILEGGGGVLEFNKFIALPY